MIRLILPAIAFGAAIVLAAPASAASFDCTKARTADEKAVCAYRALNDRDVRMAVLYDLDLKLVPMGSGAAIRDDQAAWLRGRRACGGDTGCLLRAYDRRIAQLRAVIDGRVISHGPY